MGSYEAWMDETILQQESPNRQCQALRDAKRMKRELQAVERDIGDAEMERNTLEEKSWGLDATIGCKFKEPKALSIEPSPPLIKCK